MKRVLAVATAGLMALAFAGPAVAVTGTDGEEPAEGTAVVQVDPTVVEESASAVEDEAATPVEDEAAAPVEEQAPASVEEQAAAPVEDAAPAVEDDIATTAAPQDEVAATEDEGTQGVDKGATEKRNANANENANGGVGGGGNVAAAPDKVFVCKYVGSPGEDEVLQTGSNPISVSVSAITNFTGVGSYFNDAQGRSYVLAIDTTTGGGQEGEPSVDDCPDPDDGGDITVNLLLTYMMDCPGDTTNTWRVRNPHSADIVVMYGDETHVATPGDSFFETPRGTETMVITWGGGDTGITAGQTVKAAGNDLPADAPQCDTPDELVPLVPTITECVAEGSDEELPIDLPSVTGLTYVVVSQDEEADTVTVRVTAEEGSVIAAGEGYTLNEDGSATFVVSYEECDVLGEVVEFEYTLDCDYLLTGFEVTYLDGVETEREPLTPRTITAEEAAELELTLPDDCEVVFGPMVTITEPVCVEDDDQLIGAVDVVLDNSDSTLAVWFAVWVDGEPMADLELDAGESDTIELMFEDAGSYEIVVEAIGDDIESVDTFAVFETVVVVDCVDEGSVVLPDVVTPVVNPVVVPTRPTVVVSPTVRGLQQPSMLAATGADGTSWMLLGAAGLMGLGGIALAGARLRGRLQD